MESPSTGSGSSKATARPVLISKSSNVVTALKGMTRSLTTGMRTRPRITWRRGIQYLASWSPYSRSASMLTIWLAKALRRRAAEESDREVPSGFTQSPVPT